MSEAFIGVNVRATLKNGVSVTGMVDSIDPHTQVLTLINATSGGPGKPRHMPTFRVAGQDVTDIQILSDDSDSMSSSSSASSPSESEPAVVVGGGSGGGYPSVSAMATGNKRTAPAHVDPAILSLGNRHGHRAVQEDDDDDDDDDEDDDGNGGGFTPHSGRTGTQTGQDTLSPSNPPTFDFQYFITGVKAPQGGSGGGKTNGFRQQPGTKRGDDKRDRAGGKKGAYPYSPSGDYATHTPRKSRDLPNHHHRQLNRTGYRNSPLPSDSEGLLDDSEPNNDQYYKYGNQYRSKGSSRPSRGYDSPGQNRRTPRQNGRKSDNHAWADECVDQFKEEEFDFQSNLGLFDKKKIFDEIRSNDPTDPETLLVNLNINTGYGRPSQPLATLVRNLAHNENVLDAAPTSNMATVASNGSDTHLGYDPLGDSALEDDASDSLAVAPLTQGQTSPDATSSSAPGRNGKPSTGVPPAGNASRSRNLGDWPMGASSISKRPTNSINDPFNLLSALKGTVVEDSPTGAGVSTRTSGSPHSLPHSPVTKPKFRSTSGVVVPAISETQAAEVDRLIAMEAGPNREQIIENAGRSCASRCLQILGGDRRIQPNNHNSPPAVFIMCGNNLQGSIALCAARHVANHGCEVHFFVAGPDRDLAKQVYFQQKLARSAGAILISDLAELPDQYIAPLDLIVDGLMAPHQKFTDMEDDGELEAVTRLIPWANDNKAPILALEAPSGLSSETLITQSATKPVSRRPSEAVTGSSSTITASGVKGAGSNSGTTSSVSTPSRNVIAPKWTLCLGAPSSVLTSRAISGELTLADIGIPHALWKRVGVRQWRMPWGADFLTALEYC
ncbi:hypothetical protein BJ085DRAFT_29608 [Dimargaris cristalligena]|uniref:Enhancer of mRNA-decapping protein 3 n=1 Tax=Dimargaris cristalligena TaxID=215637 RepID=A0A4P9ZXN6_9FUNG|nr:hypothetical protein BJ085DRAFT_29608 [Dimargaris cristalligena]|eukprot:RKP38475.1 hypothetical protein BJ085DRAFT_29608 [Dimargaris cristalligena]